MSGKRTKGLHSEEVIAKMQLLQAAGMEEFADYVYDTMLKYEDDIFNDGEEVEDKVKAITLLLNYFQEKEEYERCAKLRDYLTKLNETK